MARLNHVLFGQAKGKVGGMVLQRYEGMNIAREKPISVKNPQTTKQTEQRAKFKLASQFVGIFSEIINTRLSPMSIYTRTRRAEAIKAIISSATMSGNTPDSAVISLTNAVAAINAKSMSEYAAPTIANGDRTYQVTAPAGTTIIGVITSYDTNGDLVDRKIVSASGTGAAVNFTYLTEGTTQSAIFLYTVALTEEGRASLDNIAVGDRNYEVVINRAVAAGDISVSNMAATEGSN